MGTQQLLFVILGIIIVGVAIVIGLALFSGQNTASNRDAMINDLNHLGAMAHQYRMALKVQAGGQGSYVGFVIPSRMRSNDNGTYSLSDAQANSITMIGVSVGNPTNTISVVINSDGRLQNWSYAGDFR
jgi:type II secretory pathway pseudopilin PulG